MEIKNHVNILQLIVFILYGILKIRIITITSFLISRDTLRLLILGEIFYQRARHAFYGVFWGRPLPRTSIPR